MAPPPRFTVSEWADAHRVLSAEGSAEPGRWRTSRAEYQRGIMDAITDTTVETVAVMKSAQVGWTEILNNVVGFYIDHDPAPILVVQPTIEMGEAWSQDRLAPMLRDSPTLFAKLGQSKSKSSGNTLRHKNFPGGHLTIAGANSAASLASRPIRILLCDEVDRYPASAGSEGDPITLGRKRTTTFWNRKVLIGSTPTLAGTSRIEIAYQESDKRRYWVPCPHCGASQVLAWESVQWTDSDPQTALYHCGECGAGWSDAERWAAVRLGEWRASARFRGTAGFHISELYSPWRKLSETVGDFLAASAKPEMLKAWRNTALGETWQERGEAPDWERLIERREPFKMGEVPAGAVVLTAGVDVQRDRLECDIWGWGPGLESWLVDTHTLLGNTTERAVWDQLEALLGTDLPREGGGYLQIAKVGVDTGGTDTQATYGALRRARDPRLVPLKGVEGWNRSAPVNGPTLVDVTENGRKLKRGLRLWTVSVSTFKAELYRRLWLGRGDGVGYPPGWVHLPDGMEPEAVRQLVAEQLVTVKDKRGFARQEWRKLRDRNERLDCAVYARAALALLGVDRYGDRFWKRFKPAEDAAPETDTGTDSAVLRPAVPPPLKLNITEPVAPLVLAPSITRAPDAPRSRASRYA